MFEIYMFEKTAKTVATQECLSFNHLLRNGETSTHRQNNGKSG